VTNCHQERFFRLRLQRFRARTQEERRPRAFLRIAVLAVTLGSISVFAVSEPVPDVSTVPLIQRAKGKVILLDFWASWCEPCRRSFPWMNTLQTKYGDQGLMVIAVNLDKENELAVEFLKTTPALFRIEYDPKGSFATKLNVSAMPSSFLLNRAGHVVKQHAGFREAQEAPRELEIEQLLKESAP
jgi:cytochrome c biogenesis protein CcmG/thiol:disulfide interchange protein DsbE